MAAANRGGLTLRITDPSGSVRELVAEQESVIVGSGEQAAVRLRDPKVSQHHLMLRVDAQGRVVAIDLGSEKGTEVGGQRLQAPRALASGEVLTLGGSRVQVLYGEPRAPAEPRTEPALQPAHLREPLPPEAWPTPQARVLQVAMLWGEVLLDVQHFRDGEPVTAGEGRKVAFPLTSPLVGARHVLGVSRKGHLELRVPEGAGVIVTRQGEVRRKETLRAEGLLRLQGREQIYTLGLLDRAEVSFGDLSFVWRYVRPSPAVGLRAMNESDVAYTWVLLVCLLLGAAFVAGMLLRSRPSGLSAQELHAQRQYVAKLLVSPQRKAEVQRRLDRKRGAQEEGAKAKEEQGQVGQKEEKRPQADPSRPGVPTGTKRERDRQMVSRKGLLGAVSGLKGGASTLFGPGGLGTGINDALGGLRPGAGQGNAHGTGGRGARGQGPGGGGTALGLGGLGTQGVGPGSGERGGIDLAGRTKTVIKVIPGRTTVLGGLDKDVIAKVIRQHQNEIKYCYETELNKNPSLAGKVAVAFTIDSAGSVSEATVTETTLHSSPAERCILARVRRWKFPEPKGGGVVAVSYPWLFSPAGTEE